MNGSDNATLHWEPEFLGPITERPLKEMAPVSPEDLFPGASKFLSRRHQRHRARQWKAAQPLAEKILQTDEHVLYVTHAMQVPSAIQFMALGAMALMYHQVMLVITDKRIIEVLMGVRGRKAESRIRSFPWNSARDLRLSFSKLTLIPARGRKCHWKVPLRGDRKLLNPLLDRLKPLLLGEGEGMAQPLPLWHCPQCGGRVPQKPSSCDSCRASFCSPRMATYLSLAFPGAGLLYAGRPILALADFLGETLLYVVFLFMILEGEPGMVGGVIGVGVFFFLLTKAESVHLSRLFAARSRVESSPRRSRFNRVALTGGFLSLILIGGALPLAGAARPVIDRDLDIVVDEDTWRGGRNTADWVAFADDPAARSQWEHPSGVRLTLFAYAQGLFDSAREFRDEVRRGFEQQGVLILKEDEDLPAPFRGFRFVVLDETPDGEPLSIVHAFIVDKENRDIHQVLGAVFEADAATAEELVSDLLDHARWVGPSPPEGPKPAQAEPAPVL